MPWQGWVVIAVICAGIVAWVAVELVREDPNRRARRGIAKGKRG